MSAIDISWFPSCFFEMEREADTYKISPLSRKTMLAIKGLFSRRKEIAAISEESTRNKFITNKLGFLAELYFCNAPTAQKRQIDLEEKVTVVIEAYKKARESGDLQGFFNALGKPQNPCFNGRFNNIVMYAAALNLQTTEEELDKRVFDSKIDPTDGKELYELMGQWIAAHGKTIPDQQTFICYLRTTKLASLVNHPFFADYYNAAKGANQTDLDLGLFD